jgi:fused signal recognition particle receptor
VESRLREEIAAVLGGPGVQEPTHRPWVVLVTGVNGVGKTTTIGKLAVLHRAAGRRVLLIAADTFRAAAAEQLAVWAERAGADLVGQAAGASPAAVVFDGMKAAVARQVDIVLVDTAGRLHTRTNLMEELRKVQRVIQRELPGAPHETLLVMDATTGQNAIAQARNFVEAVAVTGLVVTKLDGTARGGVLIAIRRELGVPVLYVGHGEGVGDLRPFDASAFIAALFDNGSQVAMAYSP